MSETPLSDQLIRIEGLVARARLLVRDGAIVDLGELDGRVRALCDRVNRLPLEQGRPFRQRLLALYDELGLLADMVRQREELDEAIEELKTQLEWGEKRLAELHASSAAE